jgi:ubiquinone/menaquinone biosynthesis C-methylase UbiE
MNQREHWNKIYSTTPTEKVGWHTPHLETSLKWIQELGLPKEARIIDVGGGASTLVDDLLRQGYTSITVLDLSRKALSLTKERLGDGAKLVVWWEADITSIDLPTNHYDLWHDRAVFHFLTEPEQRERYRDTLLRALKGTGHLVIATFAPEAPPTCSGLPVQRYSATQLEGTLGKEFKLQKHHKELHTTPGGVKQMYLYCHFRRSRHGTGGAQK